MQSFILISYCFIFCRWYLISVNGHRNFASLQLFPIDSERQESDTRDQQSTIQQVPGSDGLNSAYLFKQGRSQCRPMTVSRSLICIRASLSMSDSYIVGCHSSSAFVSYLVFSVCRTPVLIILYYTILYYTILYYTVLYYTILYYTILYYTILYYTILYYTILYYTILYYTILCYTMLYYTILYYTILYYTILYYTILYYTVLYSTVQYSTVLYCTVLYCTVLYCTVLYCTVLYCTV